jgi:dienelactone hydrolase
MSILSQSRRVRRARLHRGRAGPVLAHDSGPALHDDGRAQERSQPRLEKIRQGEADMADTLARLGEVAEFNGNAVAMGFCYGGPYAILGPKRLGYAAGISCHGGYRHGESDLHHVRVPPWAI